MVLLLDKSTFIWFYAKGLNTNSTLSDNTKSNFKFMIFSYFYAFYPPSSHVYMLSFFFFIKKMLCMSPKLFQCNVKPDSVNILTGRVKST